MQAKKIYRSPLLTQHGNFTTLTLQGGGSAIDLPQGTPVPPGTTINDVTS